ncbi:hypothetical protein ACSBR1_015556 [Camellia fascicularis]
MGKYHHKLGKLPSLRKRSDSPITKEDPDIEDHGYTSLKDIILNSPTYNATNHELNSFSSSTISIRNELVKHAASVYVQSATILVNRNQNFVSRFWENLKGKIVFRSCWQVYVREPLGGCLRPMFRFLNYVVNQIARA